MRGGEYFAVDKRADLQSCTKGVARIIYIQIALPLLLSMFKAKVKLNTLEFNIGGEREW